MGQTGLRKARRAMIDAPPVGGNGVTVERDGKLVLFGPVADSEMELYVFEQAELLAQRCVVGHLHSDSLDRSRILSGELRRQLLGESRPRPKRWPRYEIAFGAKAQ